MRCTIMIIGNRKCTTVNFTSDILIFNRILMGSIHPEASSDKVEVGTNIVYAAVHQFGFSGNVSVSGYGRGDWASVGRSGASVQGTVRSHSRKMEIPARPFLGVRDDDWPEIKTAVLEFLVSEN